MSRLLQKAGIDGRRRMIVVGIGLLLLVPFSLFGYMLFDRSSDSSIASIGTGEVNTASLVSTLAATPVLSSWTQSPNFTLAALNGELHLVMQGAGGHLFHRSLDADGTWSGGEDGEWEWIGQGSPQMPPLLIVVGDRLHVVMQGAEGHLFHRSLDADGTWSGGEDGEWEWIGQGSPQGALLLAVVGDRLHVVMQGAGGHLFYRSLDADGTWSGGEDGEWEWIGQGSPQVPPLLVVVGDRLHVVMQGAEGHLFHRSLDADGTWGRGEDGGWEWIGQGG